jgi:hypothetical protein
MSFASGVQDTVVLPDGNNVLIRKLGWKGMKAARDAKQSEAILVQKELGADFQVQMRKAVQEAGGMDELRKIADRDPFITIDQDTLLKRGIVSWTFERGGQGVPVTPEAIDDLDDASAELVARRIFELSRTKTEEERKNSSSSSTER